MARGVSSNFLEIARREQRLGRRAALLAIALAPAAAFLAELADVPAYGPLWAFFLLTLLAGLGAGFVLTRHRLARWEGDLQLRWNHWMRQAASAERLADVHRRVNDADPWPTALPSALAAGLLALNALLFALLWVEHPSAGALSWFILAVDGLVLGALVTSSALLIRWARDFVASAEALVRDGEVAMWGER